MAGAVSPSVSELVVALASVAFDPNELDGGGLISRVEGLDEIEILDGARFFGPAIGSPSGRPLGEDVDPELRVGVNLGNGV